MGFPVVSFAPQGAPDGGPVVVHVHCGAYVNEISHQHWRLARTLAVGLGCGDLWRAQPAP
jgi:acetyl esterase/lipase